MVLLFDNEKQKDLCSRIEKYVQKWNTRYMDAVIAIAEAEEAQSETIVTYTDPVGNTFEAIDFHNEVVSNTNQLEDPKDEEEDLNDWMNLEIESNNDDFTFDIGDAKSNSDDEKDNSDFF